MVFSLTFTQDIVIENLHLITEPIKILRFTEEKPY